MTTLHSNFAFIHIPKTAGTAFRHAAVRALGRDKVLLHYKKSNPETSPLIRDTVLSGKPAEFRNFYSSNAGVLLCGHFRADDYRDLLGEKPRWCTVIRDPVERVVSEYAHILRKSPDPAERAKQLSLLEFCHKDEQINKQSRALRGLSLDDLSWVGETEHFSQGVAQFNQLFGTTLTPKKVNVGDWSLLGSQRPNAKAVSIIKELNTDDYRVVAQLRQHPSAIAAREKTAS